MRPPDLLFWAACLLTLSACFPADPTAVLTSTIPPLPTSIPPVDDWLRDTYQIADPATRRAGVLAATEAYLRDPDRTEWSDEQLSADYSRLAFSSGVLVFPDPAFIHRQGHLAVISLPDGLGIMLFDLQSGTYLELNPWAIGVNSFLPYWGQDEVGVHYTTLGNDGIARTHYVLAGKVESDWQVFWNSDEASDWWLSAWGGTLTVEPDLSRLVLVGEASNTSQAFIEEDGLPRRTFRTTWVREENQYILSPPIGTDYQAWLWQVAEPSAYATLVEFIERLQNGDVTGANQLIANGSVLTSATDFGLDLPERQFRVSAYNDSTILFHDRQGSFVAMFKTPVLQEAPWLIESLKPLGAEPLPPDLEQPE
jgi:hypothetical protein